MNGFNYLITLGLICKNVQSKSMLNYSIILWISIFQLDIKLFQDVFKW